MDYPAPERALTLTQPWATLIATGKKCVETRSWMTNYRGRLAIHAAKGFPKEARDFASTERALGRLPARIPVGAIVATARIVDCVPTHEAAVSVSALERLYGDYTPGRWAWVLADIDELEEPIGALGALGLWPLSPGLRALLGAK